MLTILHTYSGAVQSKYLLFMMDKIRPIYCNIVIFKKQHILSLQRNECH